MLYFKLAKRKLIKVFAKLIIKAFNIYARDAIYNQITQL